MNHAAWILGLVTLFAASGCGRPEPAAPEMPGSESAAKAPAVAPTPPPVPSSAFITTSGMRFMDTEGREILLRGANIVEWMPSVLDDTLPARLGYRRPASRAST
jgi:hypothetical protein